MNPSMHLEIPAESFAPTKGNVAYMFILGLGAGGFFIYLCISSIGQMFIGITIMFGVIAALLFYGLCFRPHTLKKKAKPLIVDVFQDQIQINLAKKPIPLKNIRAEKGELKAQMHGDLGIRDVYLGSAIVFYIENIADYFDVGLVDSFSPLYNDQDCFKIPMGDRGISEQQGDDLLSLIADLKTK